MLVTGGLGFIGRNLVARLLEEGAKVTVVERDFAEVSPDALKTIQKDYDLELVEADIADRKLVDSYIKNKDFLFHLAGHSGPVGSLDEPFADLEANCVGSLNLLDACRRLNPDIKIIYPSSSLVYGYLEQLPVPETHRILPLTIYGSHKFAVETYFNVYHQVYGIKSVIFRASNPYGPHIPQVSHKYNILNWFIDEASRGNDLVIFGDGKQKRDYFYVGDMVEAFLKAAITPAAYGEVFNLGYGRGTRLIDAARTTTKAVGKGKVVCKPWPNDYKAVETGDYVSDISKAKKILGWEPTVTLTAGVKKMVSQTTVLGSALSKLLQL